MKNIGYVNVSHEKNSIPGVVKSCATGLIVKIYLFYTWGFLTGYPTNTYSTYEIEDGILGLKSFSLCYSQSLLLADLKKNHTLLLFYQKKS
jgi:hypothetical protein